MSDTINRVDEFAPHWTAILGADGELEVTFALSTRLKDIPDVGLVDLLRAALIAQANVALVELNLVVSGQPDKASYPVNATIETVVEDQRRRHGFVSAFTEWEARDRNGVHLAPERRLQEIMASGADTSLMWISPRAGWGS
jgi:hypothetical protein